jgi:hypothetical protein
MSGARSVESPGAGRSIEVSEADLQAAWAVLENLAVSIDQIGVFFGDPTDSDAEGRKRALLDALGSYLNEDLVRSIGDARARLARYIPDADAEALVDSIPYWDYAGTRP